MHPKLHCWILQHVPVPQVIGCVLQQLNNQSLEAQQVCIATATDHLLQHPCNLPYARRLLTELVACLQQRHTDPTDRIADLLATTLLTALPDTGWRVKTLYYGPDSQHQDQAMVLHTAVGLLEGATGCHDWEAGFRLAEVVLSNPALVAGKHAMELGCGCGMVGIAAYRCGARSLLLTDGNTEAVANCAGNLQRNNVPVQLLQCATTDGALKPELVLAADVVYDVEVLPVLLRLLRGLLRGGHGQALLATRIRNEATLQEFLRQVPEHELTVCEWVHEAWDSVQFAHLAALDQCRNSIVFHLIKPLLS